MVELMVVMSTSHNRTESHYVPYKYVQALANDPVIISNVFSFLHDANLIHRI